MTEMNKYSKAYMDNYLAQALAARNNAPKPLAPNQPKIPQEYILQQDALPQMQQAPQASQIAAPPQEATDFSDAQGQFNSAIESGGDNASLAIALAGITGALDSHGKSKAEKEKKEYLAKALASGDPYVIAQAGQPESHRPEGHKPESHRPLLQKVLLDQQAKQKERQENQQFSMSEGDIGWQRELEKLLMQQDFNREQNYLSRALQRAQLQEKQASSLDKTSEKENAYFMNNLSQDDFMKLQKKT